MGTIVFHRVSKRFGRVEALKELSLTCEPGELTVVLGHSGAGKTTLLRLLAGLEIADEGELRIDGAVVNDLPARARGVSMAFESYALYPQRTVFDNMAFSFRVARGDKKVSEEEIGRRVRDMADLLEIGQLLERLPRQLSGGQRQRVALGRTLVRDASVHLLDEPIAHLDAKLRHHLRGGLKHLQRGRGATTLWTTPDQLEAVSVADRIAVFNHGVLEQAGTPADLYERPKNEYVARALGEPPMNIIEADVHRDGGDWGLRLGGASLPVGPGVSGPLGRLNGEGRVSVGFRPSDVAIHLSPPTGPSLETEVIVHEPLGQYGVVTVGAGEDALKVKTGKEVRPESGVRAWLVPNPDRYHFFNPRTGESLGA
ncbi:MAG: ABC transporter ATP-binding protein [Nitrospinota bacterium]|jgi:ABC-type sugar transport system ATPase subunit|nr:ABC transporter ATP-binding protein [Nitrospinota bacterium]MDP6619907.1 ABC transporter ATP-binding protein [Nitrospinota bacterium]HJM42289.1 ABC transporter ATP-binding protein [Nitrospinota bacterium]